MAFDRLKLHGIDQRAHVDAFVERVAQAQFRHAGLEPCVDILGDAFLHKKAGARAADLALVEPDGIDQPLDGAVDIGIVKDDVGGFPAQFQGQGFAHACGLFADAAAHGGRSGEGDFRRAGMGHDRLARAAIAGDDVDDAFRQSGLLADLAEEEGREGGVFGGFQNHRVARSQRRRDFPRQHQEREVPRDDLPADADGGVSGQFRVAQLGEPCVVVEMALRQGDIDIARLADRFAVVERFQHREEAAVFLQQAGQRIEVFRAGVAGQLRPLGEGFCSGRYGGVDISACLG
jgi:hypothetical protein